jgi:hypothetical protein
MATKIYETATVSLIDGTELYIVPLKIKYLRDFMEKLELVKGSPNSIESISRMSECVAIAMKQYLPSIKTVEDVEDNIDITTMHKIVEIAGYLGPAKDSDVKNDEEKETSTWADFDLAKIESEAFLLGIWKDYEELESSMSLPELLATLSIKRDLDYLDKRFLAGLQGVDLDEQSGKKEQDPWEAMKARVFSGGATSDPDDILALQGQNAQKAGFGLGMGLSYEKWD